MVERHNIHCDHENTLSAGVGGTNLMKNVLWKPPKIFPASMLSVLLKDSPVFEVFSLSRPHLLHCTLLHALPFFSPLQL